MNKKFMLLLLVIVVMFGSISAASAVADISVSDVDYADDDGVYAVSASDSVAEIDKDTSVFNGLSAVSKDTEVNAVGATKTVKTGDFSDLKTQINIASAGDVLEVNGTYKFTETLTVSKSITILGLGNAIFDGNSKAMFKLTGSDVTIQDISFINGYSSGNAGAIDITGAYVKIISCNFTNCYAKNMGGAFYVEKSASNINISNCYFKECYTSSVGGAIRFGESSATGLAQNPTLYNCTFEGNHANHGGAICCYASNYTLIDCTFKNNYATDFSGAFHAHVSSGKWINCTFENNSATNYGGAVSLLDKFSQTADKGYNFTDCTFINNYVTNNNGYGGAIEVQGNYANINNCVFDNNSAKSYGSGIEIKGNNTLVINSNLTNHNSNTGAAIYVAGRNATIEDCIISNSSATTGAAIYVNGASATIKDSVISNSSATTGAAIYINGANAIVNGTILDNNNATNGAGAYIKGNNAIFDNVTAYNNTAKSGAAIYVEGDNSKIINSNITNNAADDFGAGAYIDGSNTVVDNSTFSYNTADAMDYVNGDGGALYITGSNTTVKYTDFTRNIARNGSAIYVKGSVNIINDTFDRNQAWIYQIPINANNTNVYGSLIGGDNIANAIHYQGTLNNFKFTGMFNGVYQNNVNPVNGYKNSDKGRKLYLDDHEPEQNLNITIYDSLGNVKYKNDTVITDDAGDYCIELTSEIQDGLIRGRYYVAYVNYDETDYYKAIDNNTIIGSPGMLYIEDIDMIEGDKDNKTVAGCLESSVTGHRIANATVNITIRDKDNKIIDTFNVTTNDVGCFNYNKTFDKLAYGNYTIYGVYIEDGEPLSYNATLTVGKLDVVLVADNQTSYPYERENFTVNVTRDGVVLTDANGTITIHTEIGHYTVDVINGVATFNNQFLKTIGNHTIKMDYETDFRYNPTNGTFNWEVLPVDAPTVIKVSNASDYDKVIKGDLILYTINVTNNAPIAVLYHVVDTLPVGIIFSNASDGGIYNSTNRQVAWDINIEANGFKVITVVGIVNASGIDLSNTVNVTNTSYSINVSNDTSFHVDNLANITIVKVSNVTDDKTASYNDLVEFNITVTNYGQTAYDVKVTDLLPTGLVYVNSTPTVGTYNNESGIWAIGDLGNTSVSIKIIAKVNVSEANITNIATISSPTSDISENGTVVPTVNKSTNTTVDITKLDVVIIAINQTSYPYELRNFTVSVTKEGVVLSDASGKITIELETGNFTADVINGVATFDEKFLISLGNQTINPVYSGDNRYNNATGEFNWEIIPIPNPTVDKISNASAKVIKGDAISYNITINNNAPIAVLYHIVDTLPLGFDYTNLAGGVYNSSDRTITWDIWINANEVKVLTIEGIVNTSGVDLTNTVVVTNDTSKVSISDNTTFHVDNLANVTIIKTVNVTDVSYGDFVEFTINVTNNGPDSAIDVKVDDLLPNGLIYISSSTSAGNYNYTTGVWTIGTLNSGSTLTLTINAKVNVSEANITNIAIVTSPTSTFDENGKIISTINKSANATVNSRMLNTTTFTPENVTGLFGQNITIPVAVIDERGQTVAFDNVTVKYPNGTEVVKQVTDGKITIDIPYDFVNETNLIIKYNGDNIRYNPSFNNTVVLVNKLNITATTENKTTKPGYNVTIPINVTDENGNPVIVDNVTVVFSDGNSTVVDVVDGEFVISVPKWVQPDESNPYPWTILVPETNTTLATSTIANVTILKLDTTTFMPENITGKFGQIFTVPVEVYDELGDLIEENEFRLIIPYNATNGSSIEAQYTDDTGRYNPSSNKTTIYVEKLDVTATTENATVKPGYDVTIPINVTDENGNPVVVDNVTVVFSDGNSTTVNVTDGEFVISVPKWVQPDEDNPYPWTILVPETNTTLATSTIANVTILKLDTITLMPENVTGKFGQELTIPVEVYDELGDLVEKDEFTGIISYNATSGTYVEVQYTDPTGRYNPSSNRTTVFIEKLDVTASTENKTTKPGYNVTIPINVTDENGNPVIVDNVTVVFPDGDNVTVDVVDGEFVINVPKWVQPDEDNPYPWTIIVPETKTTLATSVISNITILKLNTTTITPENVTVKHGQNVTIPVEVYDEFGDKLDVSQVILVYPDGTEVPMEIINDNIIIDIPYEFLNETTLDIKYQGDDRYNPSANNTTVLLGKLNVTIDIPDVHGVAGEVVSVNITVIDENGVPINNTNLTVVLPDGSNVTVPIIDGIAKVKFTLPDAGTYKLYAFMEETDIYNAAQNESNVYVEAPEEPIPGIPMQHTANPIFAILLALFVLPILRYRKLN